MPVTSSAKKKMRGDERKTVINVRRKRSLRTVLKTAKETKTAENIRAAISQIDKAVKNHLMHANKAARMKSALMKEAKTDGQAAVKTVKKATKKATKPAAKKKAAAKKK